MSMHNCYDIVTHSRFKSFRTLEPCAEEPLMPNSMQFPMSRDKILSERALGIDNARTAADPEVEVSEFIKRCRCAGAHVREGEFAYSVVFPDTVRTTMGGNNKALRKLRNEPVGEHPHAATDMFSVYELDQELAAFDFIVLDGEPMTFMDFILRVHPSETYYVRKSHVLQIDCTT